MTAGKVYRFIKCYVDGGCLGKNPSPRGVYWSVVIEEDPEITIRKKSSEYHTNADAEWLALREALLYAHVHYRTDPMVIYSDSQQVVQQYNNVIRIKVERHLRLYHECHRLTRDLPFVALQWRPREVLVEKVGH